MRTDCTMPEGGILVAASVALLIRIPRGAVDGASSLALMAQAFSPGLKTREGAGPTPSRESCAKCSRLELSDSSSRRSMPP